MDPNAITPLVEMKDVSIAFGGVKAVDTASIDLYAGGRGGAPPGGEGQSVALARAIHFDAKVLIMDEPTAALGPAETAQVGELIKQLKSDGLGIFLISHDIHDVFDLADRVTVMKNSQVVGTAKTKDVTKDEVLGMIILGKCPPGAIPGPGAMATN